MTVRSLGQRIRQARQEAGLSGVALAKLIDKSQPYVSDLERGQRTPSLDTLRSLSAALGRPISYFLDEEGASRPGRGKVPAPSPAEEVRHALATLIAEQLTNIPAFQRDGALAYEQIVRVVEQAIDNAYHQLQRTLREQREQDRTGVS